MAQSDRLRVLTVQSTGTNWLQRILLSALGVLIFVTAFFFLTIALIAGAFLALIIALRWWWVMRRLRAREAALDPLEGQYTVVEDSAPDLRTRR